MAGRYVHPLQLLDDKEIRAATTILTKQLSSTLPAEDNKIHFKNISLHDPPKALLLPYLDAEAANLPHAQRGYVPRCVDITWSIQNGRKVAESTVSLDAKTVIDEVYAAKGQHGPNDRFVPYMPRTRTPN
jgi:primary-amine oxidase